MLSRALPKGRRSRLVSPAGSVGSERFPLGTSPARSVRGGVPLGRAHPFGLPPRFASTCPHKAARRRPAFCQRAEGLAWSHLPARSVRGGVPPGRAHPSGLPPRFASACPSSSVGRACARLRSRKEGAFQSALFLLPVLAPSKPTERDARTCPHPPSTSAWQDARISPASGTA